MAIVGVNFKESNAQKLILISMTVVIVAAFVERYSGTKETATIPQIFIGAFVATALLLLLSYVLPEFAVGLAITTMVAMVITKGQPFWDAINKVFKNTTPVTAPSAPSSPLVPPVGQPSSLYSSLPLSTPGSNDSGTALNAL